MKKLTVSIAMILITTTSYSQTQCKAITKKSIQCKNITKKENSLCHNHDPNHKSKSNSKTVVCSGTTKKNLVFRITTTGQQGRVPSSNDDDPEAADFTCSYSHRVDLFHGGEGWTVGSAGNVTMEGAT